MESQAFVYGAAQALTKNTFTREGFRFTGWATAEIGTAIFTDEQSVRDLTAEDGGVVELFAVWVPITHRVPITSIQINAPLLTTVVRGETYRFRVTLNEGAVDDDIGWSVNYPTYATVNSDKSVTILRITGAVILTAKDPDSGLSHSIVLRVV